MGPKIGADVKKQHKLNQKEFKQNQFDSIDECNMTK